MYIAIAASSSSEKLKLAIMGAMTGLLSPCAKMSLATGPKSRLGPMRPSPPDPWQVAQLAGAL